ncbi:MAG: hypothetical protein HKN18_16455 [Silicimonas sp.]|nr:hypothetical protein [Silicimonas sp.]
MKYRQRRKPTDFKAVLIADDRRMPVTISDASPLGVKVSGLNGVLFPEAEVSLLVRTERFSG